ncbi:type II toxin-antitoxin system PemK/MazF family toxin [Treponema zuelzerae]|uniref:mRNA interferase n=1 Tax=Teretinema zuelzerae TaxID=156 RepID=A0AAE3EI91_9SPIR|nr:type II toxin-antitoxin system PemK/MazF family toxin [Teretinema zuelzerae]MCD1655505.1 type II toxin-antitoxin system PemK/MazF family toxin [Teretinema zuelzerae]
MNNPRRGEVWLVNFDPTIGSEIKKTRTAVVVSLDTIGRLPLRIVVPITGWQDAFSKSPWLVPLKRSVTNGLRKESAADCFQMKSVSEERFSKKIGSLSENELDGICTAIQICIGAI